MAQKMSELDFHNRNWIFFSEFRKKHKVTENFLKIIDGFGVISTNIEDTLKNIGRVL